MKPKITLFVPCLVDQFVPQIGIDVVAVLRRLGYEAEFPEQQTCCGQAAFNGGFWTEARPIAERFVQVFRKAEIVVCPSGSCTAMVRRSYPELLAASALLGEALSLAKRVFEFSEFLVDVTGTVDVGAVFPHRVTYHDSCHLLRELGIREQPRKLLQHVKGIELVELKHSDECCGFGGLFAAKFPEISGAMGDVKAGYIEDSGAEFVTACDPGCLMHIESVLRGKSARTIHLAGILASQAVATGETNGSDRTAQPVSGVAR